MTKDDLDRLEELEKAATPGKWSRGNLPFEASSGNVPYCQGCYQIEWENPSGDIPFIAEFRNAAKDLIALARKGLESTGNQEGE